MRQPRQDVLERIEISKLPSLPNILVELLAACRAPDADFQALSRLIDKDTGLTAKIIDAVNAPAFGLRQTVRSLERTLVCLGIDAIKTIAITSAVHQFFGSLGNERSTFLKDFWRHSLTCAALARALARLIDYPAPEEAYLAGLLHDVGQLVLAAQAPDAYLGVRLRAADGGELHAFEQEEFGVGHHEVGHWLVGNWALDSFVADALLFHHEPAAALIDAHPLVRLVHTANGLAHERAGDGAASAQLLFGLEAALVQEQRAGALEEVARTARSLEIDIGAADSFERRQEIQARDAQLQQRLADEVRTIGLLDGVRERLLHGGGAPLIESVRDCTRLLFDLERMALFLSDGGGEVLRGVPLGDQDRLVAELAIPAGGEGIAARAAAGGSVVHSFAAIEPSVLDRQLMGLMRRPGIVCVPLPADEGALGLLVLGIRQSQLQRLEAQSPLLQAYAQELACALRLERARAEREREAAEACRASFEADAHRLVHEAKNPLQIIQNYLASLAQKLEHGHPAQEDLRTMREEIERVGQILERLRAEGAPAREPPGTVDLNRMIQDLLRMARRSLLEPRGIEAHLDLDLRLPPLAYGAGTLRQVLINLVKNAAEALQPGGRIAVVTRDHVNLDGRDCVEISVGDDGPGLPAQVAANLFQPVKSTKGGGHAGLGLTIAHNLVKQLNGSIGCRSDAATGTTFRILLPRLTAVEADGREGA